MQKTLLILLLPLFVSCSQRQKLLLQDYSFLLTDGEITKLHQSNDTLYERKCYIDQTCRDKPAAHYKILSSNKTGDFFILKVEKLDTIPLTTNPYPVTRYSVLVLKTIDNKELGYLKIPGGLTRQQLDIIGIDIPSLKSKFSFTFFSDTYLKELSALKTVTTKNDANKILETAKSDNFKTLIEKYEKTEVSDLYASGLSAELINRACIEQGFNPIGAGQAINSLLGQ
jgi:hypothetical protein